MLNIDSSFLSVHWPASMSGVRIHEPGHGLKVAFQVDSSAYVSLRGSRYFLRSFHFHHLSEHWLEGEPATMELHIVHQNPDDASYCVLGVFLELGAAKSTKSIASFAAAAKGEQGPAMISTNPNDWLPNDRSRFFYYEGSLTTPPYTESVSWVVYRAATLCTQQELIDIIGDHPQDARDIQPLNRRLVLELHSSSKPKKAVSTRRTGRSKR